MKENDRLEKIEKQLEILIKKVEKIEISQIERIEIVRVDTRTEDDLIDEAKKIVIDYGKASTALLQRRLQIGYARAARLLDILEERGIISEADGSKPRDVLVKE